MFTHQTPPLPFGGGPHYSLSAALARTELTEALTALTTRLGPPDRRTRHVAPPIGIIGPQTLPL